MNSTFKKVGIAAFVSLIIIPAGILMANDFKAASVAEIQSAATESSCAKKMLFDANRDGIEIRRRDLVTVRVQCVIISRQADAFE